uniref:3-oxo-5-alpha-steroid 4-dehydrogenase n=1 Tax=Denticeps clupeoides TaxID=299321 RepID=A0AAY4AMF8_9TELE
HRRLFNSKRIKMENMMCWENTINCISWSFILGGTAFFFGDRETMGPYGRYMTGGFPGMTCPAKVGWFFQELPAFLVPVLLFLTTESNPGLGRYLLGTYCLHYFQRTFIYALLTRGRPMPVSTVISAIIFCSMCGWLQAHYLLHCRQYDETWLMDIRLLIFLLGMGINIHSDHILRNLRKSGENTYKIPRGGMFEYVSGANFFGEILEWSGYAIATWSLPTFAFAYFTMCSIGPRAYYHHRFYIEKFSDYPKSRRAVIPFLL